MRGGSVAHPGSLYAGCTRLAGRADRGWRAGPTRTRRAAGLPRRAAHGPDRHLSLRASLGARAGVLAASLVRRCRSRTSVRMCAAPGARARLDGDGPVQAGSRGPGSCSSTGPRRSTRRRARWPCTARSTARSTAWASSHPGPSHLLYPEARDLCVRLTRPEARSVPWNSGSFRRTSPADGSIARWPRDRPARGPLLAAELAAARRSHATQLARALRDSVAARRRSGQRRGPGRRRERPRERGLILALRAGSSPTRSGRSGRRPRQDSAHRRNLAAV